MKRAFFAGLVVVLVALALYPMRATGYGIRTMLQLFMWIALAQSWNLISGLTGYVSFGHVAFYGMGAYTTAIVITRLGWPWLPAALLGGAMAMVLALVIGWPCLRLKGPYFAIAMLGLIEQVSSLFLTTQVNEAVAYILLVLVLLVRPTGLLKGRAS